MERCVVLVRTINSCHPDNGSDTFFRNVGSYKIHEANIPEYGILHV
jgi:hypothetical protein